MPLRPMLRAKHALTLTLAALMAFAGFASTAAADQQIRLIRDAELEELLRDYTDPMLRAAGLEPDAVSLYVINDPSINAFVAGGQNIFINTGLFLQLDTPNEVKGVIAHEIGHIAGGHVALRPGAMENAATPMLITLLAGIAAMATGNSDAGMALILGAQHVGTREILAYTRAQESATDQAGFDYLSRTGQSARGMLTVFERFADQDLLTARRQDPYARSHPMGRDRIAGLRARVEASPYRDVVDSAEDQLAFDMMRAKLRGYTQQAATTFNQYPANDTSLAARYARSLAFYRMPDFEHALAEVDALIAAAPDNAYFHELKGQILVESGHPAEAIEPYRRAVALKPDTALLRVSLAAAMLASEQDAMVEPARQELLRALRDDGENAFAWLQLASAHARLGNEPMAALSTAEQHFWRGSYGEARAFAMRARDALRPNTVEAQRADDIVSIAAAEIERAKERQLNAGRQINPANGLDGSA